LNSQSHNLSQFLSNIFLVLAYNTLYSSTFNGILVGVYVTVSLVEFYMKHTLRPFNHTLTQKYSSLFSTIHVWTALTLTLAYVQTTHIHQNPSHSHYLFVFICKLTENSLFKGLLYAWMIGLPLMAISVIALPINN